MRHRGFFLSFLILLIMTGCGYRFGTPYSTQSLFVPYIEGDERGLFTDALIYALSSRTTLVYENASPELTLKVCLCEPSDSLIGFIYASGNESKVVTSNEARLGVIAEVSLINCETGIVLHRCRLAVSVDYDFQSDFSHVGEDTFSIGQLKMYNQARSGSEHALAQKLAEKIVDSLRYYW